MLSVKLENIEEEVGGGSVVQLMDRGIKPAKFYNLIIKLQKLCAYVFDNYKPFLDIIFMHVHILKHLLARL